MSPAFTAASPRACCCSQPPQPAEANCTATMLKGACAFTASGFLAPPAPVSGPFAGIGIQHFDGKGNTDATTIVSINGNVQRASIQGTYTVNPDCTGSMILTFLPSGLVHHFDIVISPNGADIEGIRTDPGVVGTGAYRRLSGSNSVDER